MSIYAVFGTRFHTLVPLFSPGVDFYFEYGYSFYMEKKGILDIPGNKENVPKLTARKKDLVPFIGAGFSVPACPQWGDFLEKFFPKKRARPEMRHLPDRPGSNRNNGIKNRKK